MINYINANIALAHNICEKYNCNPIVVFEIYSEDCMGYEKHPEDKIFIKIEYKGQEYIFEKDISYAKLIEDSYITDTIISYIHYIENKGYDKWRRLK